MSDYMNDLFKTIVETIPINETIDDDEVLATETKGRTMDDTKFVDENLGEDFRYALTHVQRVFF